MFAGWSGDVVSPLNPVTITMDKDKNIIANFATAKLTVITNCNPSYAGTITGNGVYNYGTSVTVTAAPNNTAGSNYKFVNWTENNVELTKNSSYTFIITANRNLVANFVDATSVEKESGIPKEYSLLQNYPNPFNPSTTVKYTIPKSEFVTLKIYNLLGREILTLVNEEELPGNYEVKLDGTNLSSGIYFYKLQTEDFTQTKKMILLK